MYANYINNNSPVLHILIFNVCEGEHSSILKAFMYAKFCFKMVRDEKLLLKLHGTVIGLEEMVLSNDNQFSSCRMLCLVLMSIC